MTNLPLSIDSSHVDVMEAALRRYPGRALINSISLETGKSDQLLALAKKYGAMFILLPLSDRGLPETAEEKIAIIDELVLRAKRAGLNERDIVVDGLVTTVGANSKAALEALETIRYCRRKGLATVCGLSNISFGLPERSCINTAFLTMAISAGLTMAIANPAQELMTAAAFASDLLTDKKEGYPALYRLGGAKKEGGREYKSRRRNLWRREWAETAGQPRGSGRTAFSKCFDCRSAFGAGFGAGGFTAIKTGCFERKPK